MKLNRSTINSKTRTKNSAARQHGAPADLHEVECAWVPGTTDRVRFTVLRPGRSLKGVKVQVRELAVARLTVMFGRPLLDDLYLRGRARLRLDDRQMTELA